MTCVIEPKCRSKYDRMSLKNRSIDLTDRFEPLPRLHLRACCSPRRLSARFGLRFLPSQTEQKSQSHPVNGAGRHFSLLPPAGNLSLIAALGQSAQAPQKPEGASDHLHPNLNTTFGRQRVELSGSQPQIAFLKPDAVFDAEPRIINLLGFQGSGNIASRLFNPPSERIASSVRAAIFSGMTGCLSAELSAGT